MRRYFIDNIRWLCILMLFPFHIFRIYNSFMEGFYVQGQNVVATTAFIVAVSPWFMPLLFVVAGISSAYALNKRTSKEYIKERVYKLFIPLVVGILVVVPAQTFFAERFHNGFTGGYFYQYILFFTGPTDLSGYHGGFTPAHLWFILYLFVISLIALPLIFIYKKTKLKVSPEKMPLWLLSLLGFIPFLMNPVLNFGGMSVGMYLACFMLGYLILSCDALIQKLGKYRFALLSAAALCMIIHVGTWLLQLNGIVQVPMIFVQIFMAFYGWLAILAILGLGSRYLNFRNKKTDYLSTSAFPVYIFHQTWIIAVGYFVLLAVENAALQMSLILLISVLLTYGTYEAVKRVPGVRFLFGIKPPVSNTN